MASQTNSTIHLLLLLLLSRFTCVRLCATQMATHQAPHSLGFSRQEHWSGLPFPSPMHKSESEVAQSCQTLSDPIDCSLLGSSIHGSFHARVPYISVQFSSVAQSCLTLCNPMNHSTPGHPVHHPLGVHPDSRPLSQ